jgi:hypothetical protein
MAMSIPERVNNDGSVTPTLWFVVRSDSGRSVCPASNRVEAVQLAAALNAKA